MAKSTRITIDDVIDTECVNLVRRREIAGLTETPVRQNDSRSQMANTVVGAAEEARVGESKSRMALSGLALSGGGIRAACLGLGVLQSLYRRGILRQLDYISTVSGGGYIGCWLTSHLSSRSKEEKVDWDPESCVGQADKSTEASKLPIYVSAGEAQPPLVQSLANRGEQLKQPIRFLSRHLWGLLTVNTFILSGLIALGSLASYFMRWFDLPDVSRFLVQLGFRGDVPRAFFPAAVMFVIWLMCVSISTVLRKKRLQRVPPISSWAYAGLAITVMLGIVAMLTTGNVDLKFLEDDLGFPSSQSDMIRSAITWLAHATLAALGIALVPCFNLRALIRSGTQPRNRLESWLFNLASYAVIIGAPFCVCYFLASENISGWNSNRPLPNTMAPQHVKDWPAFLRKLQSEHFVKTSEASSRLQEQDHAEANSMETLWQWLGDTKLVCETPLNEEQFQTYPQQSPEPDNDKLHPGVRLIALEELSIERDRQTWIWQRWGRVLATLVGMDKVFLERWRDQHRSLLWKEALVAELNRDVLADPKLFRLWIPDSKNKESSPSRKQPLDSDLSMPAAELEKYVSPNLVNVKSEKQGVDRAKEFSKAFGKLKNLQTQVAQYLERRKPPKVKEAPQAPDTNHPPQVRPGTAEKSQDRDEEALAAVFKPETDYWWLWNLYQFDKEQEQQALAAFAVTSEVNADRLQQKLSTVISKRQDSERLLNEVMKTNWELLLAYYGSDFLYPQSEVFAYVVVEHDQARRLKIFWISLVVFLGMGLLVSVNPTLLHGFYREQLAALWLEPHPEHGEEIPLRRTNNCEQGGPLHLINCTLNLFGRMRNLEKDQLGRFTLSATHVGAERTGYSSTESYQRGNLDLADAMAISGAAVSPTAIDNILVRLLLLLFNFRLGQWLPHPTRPPGDLSWASPLKLLWGYLMREPQDRPYQFLSDGGHDENTGISPLLQRRCRVIIAVDGSQDEQYQFLDLRKLMSEGSNKHGVRFFTINNDGIEVPVDLEPITPEVDRRTSPVKWDWKKSGQQHYIILRIVYPDDEATRRATLDRLPGTASHEPGRVGYLIYLKPTLTGDEPTELRNYRNDHPTFPHDPTLDQFFEPERFMIYRQLGEHMCETMIQDCFVKTCWTKASRSEPWLAFRWHPRAMNTLAAPAVPTCVADSQITRVDRASFDFETFKKNVFSESGNAHVSNVMRHADPTVREAAAIFLREFGDTAPQPIRFQIVAGLMEAFRNESEPSVQSAICQAISWIGEDAPQVPHFLQSVANDSKQAESLRFLCREWLIELSGASEISV